jgi:hypothetical protein
MKLETEKPLDEQRRIVAYLDGLSPSLRFGDLRQAKVNALRELQVKGGEEQSALRPQGKAFKGELLWRRYRP